MLLVECIFDPFGRNQFPAMLNLSLQQSSLSVEQNSVAPFSPSQTVIRMLLLTLLDYTLLTSIDVMCGFQIK